MVLMGRSWRPLGFLGWREQMAGQLCGHLLAIQLHPDRKKQHKWPSHALNSRLTINVPINVDV
jgi:hypothetical protein